MANPTIFRGPSTTIGNAHVTVLSSDNELGATAAAKAAELIKAAVANRGSARVMIGTGNSQRSVIHHLTRAANLPWDRITVFHMDEYVGVPATHPASFRRWLREKVEETCRPAQMHYLRGDAPDLPAEIARYAGLLAVDPMDVAFVGFGENGHIAFNDPPAADFEDPSVVKLVSLDETCRRQQVNEAHFPDISAVPERALTVTCSTLLKARSWVSCVPELRKAEAVQAALEGPITTACPASIIRTHPDAHLYLDSESASRLSSTLLRPS